ncbi:MAG: hypothetical protein WD267_04360 [Balneolales bacterium]
MKWIAGSSGGFNPRIRVFKPGQTRRPAPTWWAVILITTAGLPTFSAPNAQCSVLNAMFPTRRLVSTFMDIAIKCTLISPPIAKALNISKICNKVKTF